MIYEMRIQVVGDHPYMFGDSGPLWTVRFDARLEHYDVVTPDEPTGSATADFANKAKDREQARGYESTTPKRKKQEAERWVNTGYKNTAQLGSTHAHLVMTINIGGSREALVNAMDTDAWVLLVQKHRVAGPGLPGIQGIAMGKGWHGVYDAAKANGNGRSGGTAVLVRRPVQIMRGGRLYRGTIAVISWTRRSRMHVASVYNAHEADPQHEEATHQLFGQWQEDLAEIGSVPWIIGGDWNLEPQDAESH